MKKILITLLITATALLVGCATNTNIKTEIAQNPAPKEAFANFNRYEITPIKLMAPYAGNEANEAAVKKIQEHVSLKATTLLSLWNEDGAKKAGTRTLLIEPFVTEIKFISGAARFWAGGIPGDSAVILSARIKDKETGEIIATPEFYAKADKRGGAWTFGGTDNAMLVRIANRLITYLDMNYAKPVGGPSGLGI